MPAMLFLNLALFVSGIMGASTPVATSAIVSTVTSTFYSTTSSIISTSTSISIDISIYCSTSGTSSICIAGVAIATPVPVYASSVIAMTTRFTTIVGYTTLYSSVTDELPLSSAPRLDVVVEPTSTSPTSTTSISIASSSVDVARSTTAMDASVGSNVVSSSRSGSIYSSDSLSPDPDSFQSAPSTITESTSSTVSDTKKSTAVAPNAITSAQNPTSYDLLALKIGVALAVIAGAFFGIAAMLVVLRRRKTKNFVIPLSNEQAKLKIEKDCSESGSPSTDGLILPISGPGADDQYDSITSGPGQGEVQEHNNFDSVITSRGHTTSLGGGGPGAGP